jgi:hypothetical protein
VNNETDVCCAPQASLPYVHTPRCTLPRQQPPVPVGTFSGKPLTSAYEPAAGARPRVSVPHPTYKQSITALANDDVDTFWIGARKDARITRDVLNRTKARDNKVRSCEMMVSRG